MSPNLCFWFDFGDVYVRCDLRLSFEEAVFGVKREIEVSYLETCDGCGGTGAKSSNAIKQCSSCDGKGRVMNSQRTPFGIMSQVIHYTRILFRSLAIY